MNSAKHTNLKTLLSSLLFVLTVSASLLTTVAAKPTPAKPQPKAHAQKTQAQKLQSQSRTKNDPIAKASAAQSSRGQSRKSSTQVDQNEKPEPRSLNLTSKDTRASNRNQPLNHSVAKLRDARDNSQSSGSRKQQRAAARRAAESRRLEARRQAEANRLAAIARQRAADEEMRNEVQSMIARDDIAGEDPEVRAAAVKALGNHAGTVVVMDPKTGRVYSMVNQEWAVRRGFKPCSTIKLITGLAGLNEGVIDQSQSEKISFSGSNHSNLTQALAYSKNGYFQQVGGRVGFDKMISYSRQLGLGEKTGINSPNEFKGQVPTSRSGSIERIYSHGDDYTVTPLQLAALVSAMANGGQLLTPQISRGAQDDARFKTKVRRVVNIDANTFASMVPGMVGAVDYGSGRRAHHSGASVAGKTGTCIEQGTWVGLFASYAPLANPRLAVVVIARGPDAHGHFPAAVAGRIYRDLNGRFGTPTYLPVATVSPLATRTDEEEGLAINDEELDEEGYSSAANKSGNLSRKGSGVQTRATESVVTFDSYSNGPTNSTSNNKVRRVLMTIPRVTEPTVKPAATKPVESLTRPRRVTQ